MMCNVVYRNCILGVALFLISVISSAPIFAQSYKEVTMSVGESQTLYLPSSVTSKDLKSVTFYSNGISYVQVTSYTNNSVTIKAVKAFSSPIIVRCDYYYYVRSGSYTYLTSGYYDYRVTVTGGGGGGGSGVKLTSIKFSSTAVGLSVGESRQLTPTVLPSNAKYTLTWSINDESVATISQDGLLVGKAEGAADLKVMADNGVYTMLRVVVSKPTPTSVSVSPTSLSVTEGESRYLSATVYPSNANQSVTWSSSNTSVATVTSSGKVIGVKAGIAVITVKTSNGKTATCTVTCKEAIQSITLSDKDGVSQLPAKANVTYERAFYSGWNSVCVPFAISQSMLDVFCEGCKIATIEDFEIIGTSRSLSVNVVQSIGAGEPCLIYAPKDVVCRFSLNSVALNSTPNNSPILMGSYQRKTIGSNNYKLTNDGSSFGLTKTENAIIAPFRAYIKCDMSITERVRDTITPIKIKVTQVKY